MYVYIYIYIYTCTTRWSQESLWYQAASQVPMEIMCFYLRSGGRGNDFHQVLLHTVDGQNPSPAVIAKTPHFAILKTIPTVWRDFVQEYVPPALPRGLPHWTAHIGQGWNTQHLQRTSLRCGVFQHLAVGWNEIRGTSSWNLNKLTYLPVNGRIPMLPIFGKMRVARKSPEQKLNLYYFAPWQLTSDIQEPTLMILCSTDLSPPPWSNGPLGLSAWTTEMQYRRRFSGLIFSPNRFLHVVNCFCTPVEICCQIAPVAVTVAPPVEVFIRHDHCLALTQRCLKFRPTTWPWRSWISRWGKAFWHQNVDLRWICRWKNMCIYIYMYIYTVYASALRMHIIAVQYIYIYI